MYALEQLTFEIKKTLLNHKILALSLLKIAIHSLIKIIETVQRMEVWNWGLGAKTTSFRGFEMMSCCEMYFDINEYNLLKKDFLDMEFALKYEIWEFLINDLTPETQLLAAIGYATERSVTYHI